MRYLLIILLTVILSSCIRQTRDDNGNVANPYGLSVLTVNGCQYVVYREISSSGGVGLVHSGNCHNPEHDPFKLRQSATFNSLMVDSTASHTWRRK